ncbi:MAG: sulfotransferase [bacterium]
MQNNIGRFPIIIIGMHRSGTSMITRILGELGLFLGKKKDKNQEARFFLNLNNWLLRQSGSSWDHPENIRYLLENIEIRTLVVKYIDHLLKTPRVISYLGMRNYLRFRNPFNLKIPWGWKDPRNTYTLPLWVDLFPKAKVIHIYRNGVDVANSLMVRGMKELKIVSRWMERLKWKHRFRNRPFPSIVSSVSCLSLEEGFRLWEVYTKRADTYITSLPSDRALSIKYEDFLGEPSSFIKTLCEFSGINYDIAHISKVVSQINTTRSNVYERDKKLHDFYELVKHSPQMIRYLY